MALEGHYRTTERIKDTQDFIRTAGGERLLAVAASVHQLRNQPVVHHYNDPLATHFFHKEEELRRLIARTMRNDRDARARIVSPVMQTTASRQTGDEQSAGQSSQGTSTPAQPPTKR
jgi:hypothetical protein